jgi:hypothetical protein
MIKPLKLKTILTLIISFCVPLSIPISTFALTDGQVQGYDSFNMTQSYLSAESVATLTPREQQIYDKTYNALINLDSSVTFNNFSPVADFSEVFSILHRVLGDHPEIFYYSNASYSYSTYSGTLTLNYTDTKENLLPLINEYNSKIDGIISSTVSSDMTTLEKELAIHDYLVLNTSYDYENYLNGTIPRESYTPYGIIMKNTGVCQGYAEAFQLLLNKVGIKSIVVSSYEMNHAWNIVTIDGQNYHVDVTWDDPVPDRKDITRYKYFNMSDETMQDANHNHTWDTSLYPTCTSKKYEYFTNMDYVSKIGPTLLYVDTLNYSLNKINMDGSSKTNLVSNFALHPVYHNGWIYYYSGSLYRIRPDGSNNEYLTSYIKDSNFYLENGKVFYTDESTNSISSISLPDYSKYDLNGDTNVDMLDLATMSSTYNKRKPSFYYDSNKDLNVDGIIDIYDMVKLSKEIV